MAREIRPTERELAALADGSLPPERRAELERLVAASPKLQALLAEQRKAVAAIGRRDDPAPARLHARVEALRRKGFAPARRVRLAAALAATAAVVTLALVLAISGGGPTVQDAVALASRPPTPPAPGAYHGHPTLLRYDTDRIPYPNWQQAFGWKAVGARTDRLDGRTAATVFYARNGRRVAYTIVAGKALAKPGDHTTVRKGTELRTLRVDGRLVVTWRRKGHTCVLSGAGRRELIALAGWKGGGTVPY
jgi:anti-sigma factor RsiW